MTLGGLVDLLVTAQPSPRSCSLELTGVPARQLQAHLKGLSRTEASQSHMLFQITRVPFDISASPHVLFLPSFHAVGRQEAMGKPVEWAAANPAYRAGTRRVEIPGNFRRRMNIETGWCIIPSIGVR